MRLFFPFPTINGKTRLMISGGIIMAEVCNDLNITKKDAAAMFSRIDLSNPAKNLLKNHYKNRILSIKLCFKQLRIKHLPAKAKKRYRTRSPPRKEVSVGKQLFFSLHPRHSQGCLAFAAALRRTGKPPAAAAATRLPPSRAAEAFPACPPAGPQPPFAG